MLQRSCSVDMSTPTVSELRGGNPLRTMASRGSLAEGEEPGQAVFPPGSRLDGKFRILSVVYAHGFDSVVYLADKVGGTEADKCAVKCVFKERMYGEDQVQRAREEAGILHQLAHRRIIAVVAAMETEQAFITVMPYAACGTLHARSQFKTVTEFETRNFTSQALEALEFVHERGYLHGDIKPQNFLLTQAEDKFVVQLCDFGFVERLGDSGKVKYTGMRGTSGYFSPEMVAEQAYGAGVDVFALGCIVFQLLAGYEAFDPPSHFEELDFDPRYWKHMSPECVEFVEQVLDFNPDSRPCAAACFAKPWFAAKVSEEQPVEKFVPPPDPSLKFHHRDHCPDAFPDRSRSDSWMSPADAEKDSFAPPSRANPNEPLSAADA